MKKKLIEVIGEQINGIRKELENLIEKEDIITEEIIEVNQKLDHFIVAYQGLMMIR